MEGMMQNYILSALDLCFKSNFFSFNGKAYKQVSGVGTGVKLAPTCIGWQQVPPIVFQYCNYL
jgi:hypothetical protein